MRMRTFTFRSIIAVLLLCITPAVFADAVADISIASQGACASGGTAFFITNSNTSSGVGATLTQTSVVSGTPNSSTVQISLAPGQKKLLGCSPQDSAGNFQITWQVQSAVYQ
ncbi:MAG: hypothetical protein ACJ71U_15845 [Terriglobales bacterium]